MIDDRNLSMAKISTALGKNVAYLQQFITKGSPYRLPDEQRYRLSVILNVPEQELTDLVISPAPNISVPLAATPDRISIDMLDTVACCGNGADGLTENVIGNWQMPLVDFRQITMSAPETVKMIKVKGDSMEPTLCDGDWALVDISRILPDSDGMFLLRLSTGLAIKRLQGGITEEVIVKSDNPKYSDITANIGEIRILGKVIYTLKAEKVG